MAKNKTIEIAIIQWTDSALHGTENYKADSEELRPVTAVSVGVIVKNEKDYITIATDSWDTGYYRNCATILKRQVDKLQIKRLT
mgnify:CR=1 FL=1